MTPLRFVVEHVSLIRDYRVAFARRLDPGVFPLAGLMLAGDPVRSFDMPRAHNPDGPLRLDLFGFALAPDVGAEIEAGDTVLLTNTTDHEH